MSPDVQAGTLVVFVVTVSPPAYGASSTSADARTRVSPLRSVLMNTSTHPQLTSRNKAGLVIAGLLGAAELVGVSPGGISILFFVPTFVIEPVELLVLLGFAIGILLGLVTVVGVILAWVRRSRIAARVVAAARVTSLLMISLIFLVDGRAELAPWVFVIAAALVIVNIVAIILVLSSPGQHATTG